MDSGEQVVAWKAEEAERASAPGQRGEDPRARRVAAKDPIGGQANVSTDGTMIRIWNEGWKEVKIGAISQVEVEPPQGRKTDLSQGTLWGAAEPRPSRRDEDPQVHLSSHSYCAGVWDADELGRHLYVEGLRWCIDQVERLSSVNDGARWIERIMLTHFPQAVQIVDWNHASGRLWAVGQALYAEGSKQAKQWVAPHWQWNGGEWLQQRCPTSNASPRSRLDSGQRQRHARWPQRAPRRTFHLGLATNPPAAASKSPILLNDTQVRF